MEKSQKKRIPLTFNKEDYNTTTRSLFEICHTHLNNQFYIALPLEYDGSEYYLSSDMTVWPVMNDDGISDGGTYFKTREDAAATLERWVSQI